MGAVKEHGNGIDSESFLLFEVSLECGSEVVKDTVIFLPPQTMLSGDAPRELHVFAAGGAIGFGEAADFVEEIALAEEVVGYEGLDISMKIFPAPDEFMVGKPLNKGVFYWTTITTAATADVFFLDDEECFLNPVRWCDNVGIGKEEIVTGGMLGTEVASGTGSRASGSCDALGGWVDKGWGGVGGAIVDNDDFVWGMGLAEKRLKAVTDEVFAVVDGYDNGDGGRWVHAAMALRWRGWSW